MRELMHFSVQTRRVRREWALLIPSYAGVALKSKKSPEIRGFFLTWWVC